MLLYIKSSNSVLSVPIGLAYKIVKKGHKIDLAESQLKQLAKNMELSEFLCPIHATLVHYWYVYCFT